MFHIRILAPGTLKESYWRDAVAEYQKRIGAYAKVEIVELKEQRLPETPTPGEIAAALEKEAGEILAAVPPRAALVALCVEGKQLSSAELAEKLEKIKNQTGELCLVVGSSYGLAPRVKSAATFCLSVSKLTFPHQMMRVVLLETLYRSLSILAGGKYHK